MFKCQDLDELSADIICISIGANDLLKPTREYFNSFREEGETAMHLLQRLAADHQAEKFIAESLPENTVMTLKIPEIGLLLK